jgi:metal-responsive CopG/Arc/MetJ family transcriptional regulator
MTEKRKRGRPAGSGKGRTMKTFSVNMRDDQIKKLDRISDNRSAWIRDRVDEAREKLKGKKL